MHRALSLLSAAALLLTALPPVAAAEPHAIQTSTAAVGEYIVVLRPGADRAAMVRQVHTAGGQVTAQYRHALNGFAARLPGTLVTRLGVSPAVEFISLDRVLAADAISPQFTPRGVDRIDGDLSSTVSGDGSGSVPVNVAILDSGIDAGHADLNVVGGAMCIKDKKGTATSDPQGHGTHVAGTVGALDNDLDVVGVAPGARLWSVRVLNAKLQGKDSDIICGIDWVTATRTDGDPSNDIQVANMSLGGRGGDDGNCGRTNRDAFHLALCESVAAGVTYVVSAGNDAVDIAAQVPAAYDEVLTVSAMGDFLPLGADCPGTNNAAAPWSNFATSAADFSHLVAAPGVCIPSTWPSNQVFRNSGTSMAAPHVAGTIALCIAAGPCAGLAPAQIVAKVVADSATYNAENATYGFAGDPLRPQEDRYYGYLIRAALY